RHHHLPGVPRLPVDSRPGGGPMRIAAVDTGGQHPWSVPDSVRAGLRLEEPPPTWPWWPAPPVLERAIDSMYHLHADDVVAPLSLVDGALQLPDGPGLGVEVDRDKLRHCA